MSMKTEEAQHEMAAEAGINPVRIDEIAEFFDTFASQASFRETELQR